MGALKALSLKEWGPAMDQRHDLKKKLLLKSFYLPDLKPLYGNWPSDVNPYYPELKVALDERILSLYTPEKAAGLINADYGLMAARSWPHAELRRLRTCTFWFLWLFTWDDEIDQSTSDLYGDLDNSNEFREESYHFLRHTLGVSNEETDKWHFHTDLPKDKLIRSLDVIGAELQKGCNKEQITCFVDEVHRYMASQQREQGRKLKGSIPTVGQYWETRLGTSAVNCMLALNEYALATAIPRQLMNHPLMATLWLEVNLNESLSNDMLSLRKEIKHGDIDSIVPVLVFTRGFSVQQAIEDTTQKLHNSIERFDQVAEQFLQVTAETLPGWEDEIERYIGSCRYNQTANLLWSLVTPRYGLSGIPRDAQGGMTIVVAES